MRIGYGLTLLLVLIHGAAWAETARRPYAEHSPWNQPIGPDPTYDVRGTDFTRAMNGPFGVDPGQYTLPIYEVDEHTPRRPFKISGYYSEVSDNDQTLTIKRNITVPLPIPDDAVIARGTDANVVFWDPKSGDEWGFWRTEKDDQGQWSAVNGYHYNTNWDAVPPVGFASRGGGLPYFAGLIRPWEIRQGRIEHALALAINFPSTRHIYPATKSDGRKDDPHFLPEGARLQLDPAISEEQMKSWGLERSGIIIAKALQEYGMILVDGGGHPKIMAEYEATAHWGDTLHMNSIRKIPYESLKVLSLLTPARPPIPIGLSALAEKEGVVLSWPPNEWSNRYRIERASGTSEDFVPLTGWISGGRFMDSQVELKGIYRYRLLAANHNGASAPSAVITVDHNPLPPEEPFPDGRSPDPAASGR